MATLSKGKTFTDTEEVTAAKLHQLVDSGSVTSIVNADIDAAAAIAYTKLNLSGGITNDDINASAAIIGTKLDLSALGAVGATTPSTAKFTQLTINDAGADLDSRVEGDTDENLIYTDAGNDRVGIGTATPATKLHVVGSVRMVDGNEGANKVFFGDANGTAAWGLNVRTGNYTGNGNATQAITVGTGCIPRVIVVYRNADSGKIGFKTDQDGTRTFFVADGGNSWLNDHIISLDANGFTVGDGTGSANNFNINEAVYTYIVVL